VALTAEQMSLLTEDGWLVNTRVQLADGSWQTVMVPQVYVRVQPGD
jgi:filamentous hemagglutinin